MAQVLIGRLHGRPPAQIHAGLQLIQRTRSKFDQWQLADLVEATSAGDRATANRLAAAIDARPAGSFLLAVLSSGCHCGAPFDLEATANFKARLAESGLRWPPPATIVFPPRGRQAP